MSAAKPTPQPPKVLVVTRRLHLLDDITALLEAHGNPTVHAVRQLDEALALAQEQGFERVWLDADLPGAHELVSHAGGWSAGNPARAPSLVVLKDGLPQDHMAWVAMGVSEFVEAPWSPDVFEARWVAWLKEREVLWQRYSSLALADNQTGLPNAAAGWSALVKTQASALRSGYPLSVVLWAIPAPTLPHLADHIQHNIRNEDWLVRWAEDRLLLVLSRSSLLDASRLVERLFKNLTDTTNGLGAGVATLSPSTKDEALITLAEQALEAALQAGDGSVAMASAGGPRVLPHTRRT